MLRIILFIATNLAVMVLLTIVVKVTGLDVYAYNRNGINLQQVLRSGDVVMDGYPAGSQGPASWADVKH